MIPTLHPLLIKSVWECTLVLYCCVINYHKLSIWKQHKYVISQFPMGQVNGVPWSGSHQVEISVPPWAMISSKAQSPLSSSTVVGRIHFYVIVGLRSSTLRSQQPFPALCPFLQNGSLLLQGQQDSMYLTFNFSNFFCIWFIDSKRSYIIKSGQLRVISLFINLKSTY